jgi:GTPase involved in cell partitioning and DNA repair
MLFDELNPSAKVSFFTLFCLVVFVSPHSPKIGEWGQHFTTLRPHVTVVLYHAEEMQ